MKSALGNNICGPTVVISIHSIDLSVKPRTWKVDHFALSAISISKCETRKCFKQAVCQ